MEKLTYKLDAFEGPLDLLLYLIRKNQLDICDIPISELLEQYLRQIDAAKAENMEVASEFLEMAARLVYLKTVSLLPKHEEAEALRAELTGQLLEYEECKRVAGLLREQFQMDLFVRAPEEIEPDYTYQRRHDPRELLLAYYRAAGHKKLPEPPTKESFSGIVSHRIVSVASQIIFVLRNLWKKKTIRYETLFSEKRDKSELVAAFLAVLELVKGKRVRVDEEPDGLTVKLTKAGERSWKAEN